MRLVYTEPSRDDIARIRPVVVQKMQRVGD